MARRKESQHDHQNSQDQAQFNPSTGNSFCDVVQAHLTQAILSTLKHKRHDINPTTFGTPTLRSSSPLRHPTPSQTLFRPLSPFPLPHLQCQFAPVPSPPQPLTQSLPIVLDPILARSLAPWTVLIILTLNPTANFKMPLYLKKPMRKSGFIFFLKRSFITE